MVEDMLQRGDGESMVTAVSNFDGWTMVELKRKSACRA
jgi:hypothetical protein